jgi:hypothetical protein
LIEFCIYPTDALINFYKNVKFTLKFTLYLCNLCQLLILFSSCYWSALKIINPFHTVTYTDSIYSLESFIYPADAQLDCSKNVKIYIKIYTRGAPTCFGFLQPSSGSYYMCFAKVISINKQLKCVVYRIISV